MRCARRPHLVLLIVVSLLAVLAMPAGTPGGWRDAAAQANTVSLEVWTCPTTVDPSETDPAYFEATCTEPTAGLDFILTRDGLPSTRTTDDDGSVRPWSAVTGRFGLRGNLQDGETIAVFCDQTGTLEPVTVEDNAIAGELAPGEAISCRWYWAPSSSAPPTSVPTAEPTDTPVPATNTPEPTAESTAPTGMRVIVELAPENDSGVTGTAELTPDGDDQTLVVIILDGAEEGVEGHMFDSTCDDHGGASVFYDFEPVDADGFSWTVVDAPFTELATGDYWIHLHEPAAERGAGVVCGNVPEYREADPQAAAVATATAVPDLIAADEPNFGLDIPTGLQYSMDDRFNVYPQPGSRGEFTVEDFVVEAVFGNPPDDTGEPWDYGFLFGPTGSPEDYRLSVQSDGQWIFELDSAMVQSGPLDQLNIAPREVNTLQLVVAEGTAFFSVNDVYVATLDVPATTDGGTLWLVTSVQSEVIQCRSHRVWQL